MNCDTCRYYNNVKNFCFLFKEKTMAIYYCEYYSKRNKKDKEGKCFVKKRLK